MNGALSQPQDNASTCILCTFESDAALAIHLSEVNDLEISKKIVVLRTLRQSTTIIDILKIALLLSP